MWFVMREEEPEPRTMMPETIPWKLLQGIALVQLYREEKWVEPPELDRLPYSLLYHQTMSTLASTGELTPAELAQRVLTLSYFHRVSADDYRVLLRHLIKIDHIQVTEGGGLIVGLAGERIINNFKFYAVFQENEEFTVRSESAELGTIVNPPPPGERIAIAGHCWIVEEVDWKRHTVFATQVKGRVPAYFGDCPGDINTHVLERMRKALNEHATYPYLMGNARARLAQARHTAEISGAGTKPLINLGGDTWVLFPWLGSFAFLALERMLKIKCAAALGLHQGQHLVHRQERSAQVDVHHAVVVRLGGVHQQLCDLHARDVDQDIDAAESLHGLGHGGLDRDFAGDVARAGDGLPAKEADLLGGLFQPRLVYIHQEELCALHRQAHRRAAADAGSRAGDQRDLVLALHGSIRPPFLYEYTTNLQPRQGAARGGPKRGLRPRPKGIIIKIVAKKTEEEDK